SPSLRSARSTQMEEAIEESRSSPTFVKTYGLESKVKDAVTLRRQQNSGPGYVIIAEGPPIVITLWGWDCIPGQLSLILGAGVAAFGAAALGSPQQRARRTALTVLASALTIVVLIASVMWLLRTPQKDVVEVFSRGSSLGNYGALIGSALVIVAMWVEGLSSHWR
ncbi:MAG TPA: hypothetical protein VMY39_10695, partial [Planctomycetota bacterium]|nr:hypothetical protein [Planctomycetota bacterium]